VSDASSQARLDHDLLPGLLDAMDGTAYATDIEGRLLAVGSGAWGDFAKENGEPALANAPPIGRPILEAISGDYVRASYRRLHDVAARGERRIAFAFRCDTPDVERRMKMAIGPLRVAGRIVGVLYQATILSERTRPPLRFLELKDAVDQHTADKAPIITYCSFCARIDWLGDEGGDWVSPEIYYQRGGSSAVRVSHGVCPRCLSVISELSA
jgi:hypothetical protein